MSDNNEVKQSVGSQITMNCRFTAYEMTQYILKALGLEDESKTTNHSTFKMYGYRGSLRDLYLIVEDLAIADTKIEKIVSVPHTAWGCGWMHSSPGSSTNFNYQEIDLFIERVHYLLNQMIIAPGNSLDISLSLPWIHVTNYGMKCIAERDILPYDSDGYLARIKTCSKHDDWDIHYINQVLKCFNCGAYDAATMILGVEGEYLAKRIIERYKLFLNKNEPNEESTFDKNLKNCSNKLSQEYTEYCNSLKRIKGAKDNSGNQKYPNLIALTPKMDAAAHNTFMTYLRLTRNELAHPSSVTMEPSHTMLLIISFLKYYEIQNEFIEFYDMNS